MDIQKYKKNLIRIDNILLKGFIQRMYLDYIKKIKKKNKPFYKKKKSAVILEPVYDMILMQINNNENEFLNYSFYDLAIRYLAVENYYGINDYGFSLYKKMHTLCENYGQINDSEKYYSKMQKNERTPAFGIKMEQHSIEQFSRLIKAVDENGFDSNTVVMADRNMLSMNGSHRITLALWHDVEFINVEVYKRIITRTYEKEWFWKKGFSNYEISLIEKKQNEIIRKCKEDIGEYYCLLYPGAANYFDEIQQCINQYDTDNISIVGVTDCSQNLFDFLGFVRFIYQFDSILPANLERKIFYILSSVNNLQMMKIPVRILKIKMNNPKYRLKSDNGMPESVAMVRLKESIRERFKRKETRFSNHYVGDYDHDVIIHSTDNYLSNKAFKYALELDRNISELFELLKDEKYVLLESNVNSIPLNFPSDFYIGSTIYVLCNNHDERKLIDIIDFFCKKKFIHSWINVYREDSIYGRSIVVKFKEALVVKFEVQHNISDMEVGFINKCIDERINRNGYYFLSNVNELDLRMSKCKNNKNDLYDSKFIFEHANDIEEIDKEPERNKHNTINNKLEDFWLMKDKKYEYQFLMEFITIIDKDISSVFKAISDFDYAIVQRGNYSQNKMFPYDFLNGVDVDIFVDEEDYLDIAENIRQALKNKYSDYGAKIQIIKDKSGCSIDMIYAEKLILKFDLIFKMQSLTCEFVKQCLTRSVSDGVCKRLSLNDELNYRLAAFSNSKGKKIYHAEYVKKHIESLRIIDGAFVSPQRIIDDWNNYLSWYDFE